MLERKYGNHPRWKRILEKQYVQSFVDTQSFRGYLSLFKMVRVSAPLSKRYGTHEVCIADNGFSWLHQFPLGEKHAVTTMFDSDGKIVQWYIDLCDNIGTENGIPRMDDLFLDIVVLPSGELFQLDADELDEAYSSGTISHTTYHSVLDEAVHLCDLIKKDEFKLLKLSSEHRKMLEDQLQ